MSVAVVDVVDVVGVSFVSTYPNNLHQLARLTTQVATVPAVLVRNPANKFDTNAVEVHVPSLGDRPMVGHVPADTAERLAPLMDDGVPFVATVADVRIDPAHPDRPGMSVRIERTQPVSIPLDQPAAQERKPGEFARHPKTGAPYVSDPTKTRKPTGTKPQLIAKCEERGIEVPPKATIGVLQELLGPEQAAPVQYGRPSALGKQIENLTNLQKWSERAVALGMFLDFIAASEQATTPSLVVGLDELADDQLTLDDELARELLDKIAVKAKNIAQAGIAAERGTHTHALTEDFDNEADWIERARSGTDLGIPIEAQRALVEAWEQMLDAEGIEILAVETAVVDDTWRQAGTLDRIARLTRARSFTIAGGEIVTLPAGWVGVLDVKTGGLRIDRSGHPEYWHGYAVQIASYAQAVPYNPDTDLRGEWEWPIDQQWGIIAHLDVKAALAGQAECRLVLVDLEAGRYAGQMCVAAREWEKRRNVFSLVVDEPFVVPVVPNTTEPPQAVGDPIPTPAATIAAPDLPQTVELPATVDADKPSMVAIDRDELRDRKKAMRLSAVSAGWVERFDREWAAFGIGPSSTEAEIKAALDAIEPPFDNPVEPQPRPVAPAVEQTEVAPGDGGTAPAEVIDELIKQIRTSKARHIVNGWLGEANHVGASWSPRNTPTARNVAISTCALAVAEAAMFVDDFEDVDCDAEFIRLILNTATGDLPDAPIGVLLGCMSIDDTAVVIGLVNAIAAGQLVLKISDMGAAALVAA